MATTLSAAAIPFIRTLEGTVLHAYRDSGGVITIGIGFTMRSEAFSKWWLERHTHALRMGDTMTVAECEVVLPLVMRDEYLPPIVRKFGTGLPQNQFDQCGSTVYNCGAGTLSDRWANALALGNVEEAARLLRSTRTTAAGKHVQGLVNRREEEAELMKDADYRVDFGKAPGSTDAVSGNISRSPADVVTYQTQLTELGYYTGPIDGKIASSDVSVRAFQRDQGLLVDGDVGRATRARLGDAITKKRALTRTGQGAATGGLATGGTDAIVSNPAAPVDPTVIDPATVDPMNWVTVGIVVAVVAALIYGGYTLYRYRFAILAKGERLIPGLKKLTGGLKPQPT